MRVVVDQGVFVREAPWFRADNGVKRGGRDLAGTVWAAVFLASEKAREAKILPARVGTGKAKEMSWMRSPDRGSRLVTMVEYDSQENLMRRGIVIPQVSQFDPPEAEVEASGESEPRIGRSFC